MAFKVGDRVKVKDKVLSKMHPSISAKLAGQGIITVSRYKYVRVKFKSVINGYWFHSKELELAKNQQLLFDFMV